MRLFFKAKFRHFIVVSLDVVVSLRLRLQVTWLILCSLRAYGFFLHVLILQIPADMPIVTLQSWWKI